MDEVDQPTAACYLQLPADSSAKRALNTSVKGIIIKRTSIETGAQPKPPIPNPIILHQKPRRTTLQSQ